jgi:predicted nucleic acid-binding protein
LQAAFANPANGYSGLLTATPTSTGVTLTSLQPGTTGNLSISCTATHTSSQFSTAPFATSCTGMSGGANAQYAPVTAYSYSIANSTIASGKSPASREEFRRLNHTSDAQLCISVFTEAEVRFRMNWRGMSPTRRQAIEGIFALVEILPWGSQEASVYATVLPGLRAAGIGVSQFDFLIGIQVAATGAILVSHDSIFPRIAALTGITQTIDWASDV